MESSIGTSCIQYSIIIRYEVLRAHLWVPDECRGFQRDGTPSEGERSRRDAGSGRGIRVPGEHVYGPAACGRPGVFRNRPAEEMEGEAAGPESGRHRVRGGTNEGISRGPV